MTEEKLFEEGKSYLLVPDETEVPNDIIEICIERIKLDLIKVRYSSGIIRWERKNKLIRGKQVLPLSNTNNQNINTTIEQL